MSAIDSYHQAVLGQFDRILSTQRQALEQAAAWVAETLGRPGWVYVFGTGHSGILAEEVFYRAGGLVRAVPIFDERLMLHVSASQSTTHERTTGLADDLLPKYEIGEGDVLFICSNSGRNAVPIELALGARARGVRTVALTNRRQSFAWPARHPSGKRLAEVADLVLDNEGADGDAVLELPGVPGRVGPTSTLAGAFIMNAILVRGIELAATQGPAPELYISSNAGGDEHNRRLLDQYRTRIRHL